MPFILFSSKPKPTITSKHYEDSKPSKGFCVFIPSRDSSFFSYRLLILHIYHQKCWKHSSTSWTYMWKQAQKMERSCSAKFENIFKHSPPNSTNQSTSYKKKQIYFLLSNYPMNSRWGGSLSLNPWSNTNPITKLWYVACEA